MANRPKLKLFMALGILALALVLGTAAYAVFRPPAQASGPIEAIPLAQAEPAPSGAGVAAEIATTAAPPATSAAAETEATNTPQAAETAAANTTPQAADTVAAGTAVAAVPAGSSGPIVAQIVQEESEARFIIDEVLNNAPKTVVGTTDQVAGELEVDPADPSKSRVGIIQVNARGLTTDSGMRNRAIANRILQTAQYEFVTFTPKQLVGLPTQGAVGQSYSFQIVGDLAIRDVTRETTFDVTVTPVSENRLEGTATATILRTDFGLTIPQVRQVASVSEEVRLEIDFVAVPK
ncbi:MAG TPA: YceI family protein [Herpetosiphonaceae bacterium]|nr:YceI family protein [Herpetosiphonaceae bacterium]